MADRVKYFLLGLLFLVVAGVIAYDRWNSREITGGPETADAERNRGSVWTTEPPIADEPGPNRTGPNRRGSDRGEPESNRGSESESGSDSNDGRSALIVIPPGPDGRDRGEAGRGTADRKQPDPIAERSNDRGPNVSPTPIPGPKPDAQKPRVHVVRSGDSLEKISSLYFPGRVHFGIQEIVRANGLADPNRIRIDQKLIIPTANVTNPRTATVRKPETAQKKTPAGAVPSAYTVKQGDGDLYAICRKLYRTRKGEGRRVAIIMEMNNLWSVRVKPGTTLKLPPK
ncbi:MAG: LysM peptidoglycan-binding domain-containing protein [Planctomycetota bacterium]